MKAINLAIIMALGCSAEVRVGMPVTISQNNEAWIYIERSTERRVGPASVEAMVFHCTSAATGKSACVLAPFLNNRGDLVDPFGPYK